MCRRLTTTVVTVLLASCGGEVARLPEVDVPGAELGATCLSGRYWPFGERGDNHMHPGRDCVGCHARSGRGPVFAVAGTLYSAPHEVDECYGYDSDVGAGLGAEVEVVDAAGARFAVIANRAGNFYTTHPLAFPLQRVRVYAPDGTFREMGGPAPHGDCNACHTRLGTVSALGESPGRLVVP